MGEVKESSSLSGVVEVKVDDEEDVDDEVLALVSVSPE